MFGDRHSIECRAAQDRHHRTGGETRCDRSGPDKRPVRTALQGVSNAVQTVLFQHRFFGPGTALFFFEHGTVRCDIKFPDGFQP